MDGQPIPDSQIRCDLRYGKRRPIWQVGYAEATTGTAGRFAFEPLPVFKKQEADYRFFCDHPDYAIGKFRKYRPGKTSQAICQKSPFCNWDCDYTYRFSHGFIRLPDNP